MAGLVLLGQLLYVVAGLRLAQARARAYAALLLAPAYMLWKLGVYLSAALGRHDGRWVRTARRPARHGAAPPKRKPVQGATAGGRSDRARD